MLKLPDLKQLKHIVEWDDFVTGVLIPECVKRRYDVDYEFLEDRCCVIGHFDQDQPEDWQRFIDDFIKPFCQERGWSVEAPWEEDSAVWIDAPPLVEDPEPATDVQQLNFYNLCPSDPKNSNHPGKSG